MNEKYIQVKDLIQWLLENAPEDAIVCSSEEGNAYPIAWTDLDIDGYEGKYAVFIG